MNWFVSACWSVFNYYGKQLLTMCRDASLRGLSDLKFHWTRVAAQLVESGSFLNTFYYLHSLKGESDSMCRPTDNVGYSILLFYPVHLTHSLRAILGTLVVALFVLSMFFTNIPICTVHSFKGQREPWIPP